MLFAFLAFGASAFVCVCLVRYPSMHLRYSADQSVKPQAFHRHHVSRIGGSGVFIGLCLAVAVAATQSRLPVEFAAGVLLVVTIAFLSGFMEDLTKRVSPLVRLLLTFLAAIAAVYGLDVSVPRSGITWVDSHWAAWPMVGPVLALVAIGGLPHAVNLIDGYNGLMGMVATLILCAIGYVAYLCGDRELMLLCGIGIGAICGFLILNYPRGLIFAGDGGAYLIGAYIALLCILLVQRNAVVSPWFAVLVVSYPVCETVFSIYRKLSRGQSPSMADALHIHQLIYRRIVTQTLGRSTPKDLLKSNSATSPYLWAMGLITVFPAMIFFDRTYILIFCVVVFIATYVWLYASIVRFQTPRFLKSKAGKP
jgi:UDP-GlcNAc:undecaprenyl-phosphate/decaprenyl-phosphate GlcNAc-1-phosphate transferase